MYDKIEALLLKYCFGQLTARQCQASLKVIGYIADLKGNSHIIDVFPISGGVALQIEV